MAYDPVGCMLLVMWWVLLHCDEYMNKYMFNLKSYEKPESDCCDYQFSVFY